MVAKAGTYRRLLSEHCIWPERLYLILVDSLSCQNGSSRLPYRTWQCTGQDSGLKAPLTLLSLLHLPPSELDTGKCNFPEHWLLKTAADPGAHVIRCNLIFLGHAYWPNAPQKSSGDCQPERTDRKALAPPPQAFFIHSDSSLKNTSLISQPFHARRARVEGSAWAKMATAAELVCFWANHQMRIK